MQNTNQVEVVITMADGQRHQGSIVGGVTSNLATILNRPGGFIELIEESGKKRYLGIAHVASVMAGKGLQNPDLPNARKASEHTAYSILKLEPGCSAEDLRQRYREMVKSYHPDKFAATGLPDEVSNYIRQTFEALSHAHQLVEDDIRSTQAG